MESERGNYLLQHDCCFGDNGASWRIFLSLCATSVENRWTSFSFIDFSQTMK